MLWGMEDHVTERFVAAGIKKENISFGRDVFTFNASHSSSELVHLFRLYYGPTMNAFEAAEKNGKAADLQHELEMLFSSQNKSIHELMTSIPANFLKVTILV